MPTSSKAWKDDEEPEAIELTAEDYRNLCKQLDEDGAIEINHSETTDINIEGIRGRWERFCEFVDESDPYDAIQRASKGTCMGFLRWILENYNVPKKSSIQQYWRQFKMLYVRCTGRRMNENDAREVFKYIDGPLKKRYGLDLSVKSKPVMNVDDLLLVLTHHWARDTSNFPTERQRVQLPMILITAAYTASRPGELVDAGRKRKKKKPDRKKEEGYEPWDGLDDSDYDDNRGEDEEKRCKALCYEDICLMLLRNPDRRDRDVLTMEVRMTHHKGAERKPKPTTFLFHEEDDPIFCPIAHMLALAFVDDAFEAPSLKRAEDIFKLKIRRPFNSVQLRWKESMLKTPIFRQAVRCVDGFLTSPRKALRYSTFDYYLERLGCGTGFEEKLSGYCARRGTGNAVDGAATKAVRDKVMRHDPKSNIFEAYLNERVKFDVQAAFLERPSQDGLLRAFAYMSLTCDPRAPISVDSQVLDALPPDPKIHKLCRQREELKLKIKDKHITITQAKGTKIHKEYNRLNAAIRRVEAKRRRVAKKEYRKEYFRKRHTEEIERQLNGLVSEDEYVEPVVHHQFKERSRLEKLLCTFPTDFSKKEILRRRIEVIDNMTRLCRRREVQSRKSRRVINKRGPPVEEEEAARPDPFPLVCKETQCPFCIGNEMMSYSQRTFSYCRPSKMMDHVERSHLREIQPNQPIPCRHPTCKSKGLLLENTMHFKNHVQTVHGISLRA